MDKKLCSTQNYDKNYPPFFKLWNYCSKRFDIIKIFYDSQFLFLFVKELMEGNADISVGAMTINFARESVIDFTKVKYLYFLYSSGKARFG